jgi:hypothetical protein
MHRLALGILFFVCASLNTYAQLPSINATVSSNSIVVGDHIKYTVRISYDPDIYSIGMPVITDDMIQPFVVIASAKADSAQAHHQLNISKEYTISCYDSGLYDIPIPQLNILHEGTAERIQSDSGSIRIAVNNIPVDVNGDIKEIKQASLSKSGALFTARNILIAAVLIAIILAAVLWFSRSKALQKKQSVYNRSLAGLQQLATNTTLSTKEFYVVLTAAVKQYIGERFRLPLQTQTSTQALHTIADTKLIAQAHAPLSSIFATADKAKFAHEDVPADTMQAHLQAAQDMIKALEQIKLEQLRIELEAIKQQKKRRVRT